MRYNLALQVGDKPRFGRGHSIPREGVNGAGRSEKWAAGERVPASVTLSAGSQTATFAITTTPVVSDTSVTISGSYNGVTKSTTLTVLAPVLKSLSFSPTRLAGGAKTTLTIMLTGPVASGSSLTVGLSSSDPTAAPVPASVTIPAGKSATSISILTGTVTSAKTVSVTGTQGTNTASASVTVNP